MLAQCKSISYFPDISNWNISNVVSMEYMLCDCLSLSSFPFLPKWKINPKTSLYGLFNNCISLSYLPIFQNKPQYENVDEDCFQLIIKNNKS